MSKQIAADKLRKGVNREQPFNNKLIATDCVITCYLNFHKLCYRTIAVRITKLNDIKTR
jgi:hypothetical protein